MSIITVDNVSLNFGSRKILENVSFRLLKGEKIGLIGANGEGKSTFMNILTNKITPEAGSISISNKVKVGYLDQHALLKKGTTIYDNLKKAFQELFDTEKEIISIYSHLENLTDEQMNEELEKAGKLQSIIDNSDFYLIDSKIESVWLKIDDKIQIVIWVDGKADLRKIKDDKLIVEHIKNEYFKNI